MSKELKALKYLKENKRRHWLENDKSNECLDIIEAGLKRLEELEKIEYKQNTINDFYPNTKKMIDDLLDLVCTKMCDFLQEGKTYTRTGMLETLGFAIRYVKTFAYGGEFNETEKIGVNAKKIKAFEIIKNKIIPYSPTNRTMIQRAFDEGWITQEEYNLLNEVLL